MRKLLLAAVAVVVTLAIGYYVLRTVQQEPEAIAGRPASGPADRSDRQPPDILIPTTAPASQPSFPRRTDRDDFVTRTCNLWKSAAAEAKLDAAVVARGVEMLRSELTRALPAGNTDIPEGYGESFRYLVLSQRPMLRRSTDGPMRFIILWTIEGLRRKRPAKEVQDEVLAQFKGLLPDFEKALREKLTNALGGRPGFEQDMDNLVSRAKQLSVRKLIVMQRDCLFPGFDRPWTAEELKGIQAACRGRLNTGVFRADYAKRDPVVYYRERLAKRAATATAFFIESAAITTVWSQMDHNAIWGKCLWGTETTPSMLRHPAAWPFWGKIEPNSVTGDKE